MSVSTLYILKIDFILFVINTPLFRKVKKDGHFKYRNISHAQPSLLIRDKWKINDGAI